jgi:hypothetical protein
LNRKIRLQITSTPFTRRSSERSRKPDGEEYLSNDGSCLLQLQKDSEIRFGPTYYKAAIYGGDGKLALDFGARRFFSCAAYSQGPSNWTGPWSPTSLRLALPELLSTHPEPGEKITRMSIFDVSRQMPVVAWDFESLVTHKMWSSDGHLYLFRDVYAVYSCPIESCSLIPLSTSKSPYCFLVRDEFVCVIEQTGEVCILEGYSGNPLETGHISEPGYAVKNAMIDEKMESISIVLKRQTDSGTEELSYSVTVLPTD